VSKVCDEIQLWKTRVDHGQLVIFEHFLSTTTNCKCSDAGVMEQVKMVQRRMQTISTSSWRHWTTSHGWRVNLIIWLQNFLNVPHLNSSQLGQYLIYLPRRDGRLSWPRWLVTYSYGFPVCRPTSTTALSLSLSLRSSSQELLTVPHCKTMLDRCRFSVAAPRVWNSLPLGLKTNCDSLRGFKTGLKTTYLFCQDYNCDHRNNHRQTGTIL